MKPTILRRSVWFVIAIAAFFSMASSSPECARTNDQILSPQTATLGQGSGTAECVAACVAEAQARRIAEQERYRNAIQTCGGDPECIAAERAINQTAKQEIVEDSQDCKRPCHEQGKAKGGQ